MTPPVPWPITAVESPGGTWLRVTHRDGTVAEHDMARLIGRGGVFATFTAATIGEARLIDDTVGWTVDGQVVDLAPDAIWDHAHGRCGGGGCTGWSPEQTVVVRLPTDAVDVDVEELTDRGWYRRRLQRLEASGGTSAADAVVDQIIAAWAASSADTSALDAAPPLDQPGARDWAALLLVERARARIGAAVIEVLDRELPLTVASLCVREVIRECNGAYMPIAGRVATAAAAGGKFDVAAAVAEAEPFLRERISLAVERARRRA